MLWMLCPPSGHDDLAVDEAALRGETADEDLTKLADDLNYKVGG